MDSKSFAYCSDVLGCNDEAATGFSDSAPSPARWIHCFAGHVTQIAQLKVLVVR